MSEKQPGNINPEQRFKQDSERSPARIAIDGLRRVVKVFAEATGIPETLRQHQAANDHLDSNPGEAEALPPLLRPNNKNK